jgi:glutathione S-transferase
MAARPAIGLNAAIPNPWSSAMKLYMHPVSTGARPVLLLIAENNIPCEEVLVDMMKGEHHQPPYSELNPNRMIPMLDDDGFQLTESSAIMKYIADKFELAVYPKDLKQRARVNEAMDWLNTQFYRDFGYGLVYPQLFPNHKRRSDEAHGGCIEWGKKGAQRWLQVLDTHWLGQGKTYLCGDAITIADYFGACLVSIGELVGCDFADYPNIRRWLAEMRKLKSWPAVNAVFENVAAGNKGKEFVKF